MIPDSGNPKRRKIRDRFEEWFLNTFTFDGFDSIKLSDVNADKTDDAAFFECAKESLALVRRKDARRYARIRQHLKYVVNAELLSAATYGHSSKACRIDFGNLYFKERREWTIWCFAGYLVHEATHGLVESKGIEYSKDSRSQIERICRDEQNRFLKKAPLEFQGQLIRPYTPDDWAPSWNRTRVEYFFESFLKIRKSLKKATPSNNHGCGKAILGFPLIGLVLTVLWIVYETVAFETLEGGSDPGVIQKSMGYTLIPFGVGIVAGLATLLLSKKRANDQ
jgi:hypothetical protein